MKLTTNRTRRGVGLLALLSSLLLVANVFVLAGASFADLTIPLNPDHVGKTAKTAGSGDCPDSFPSNVDVWHFIAPGNANFTSLTVEFNDGAITRTLTDAVQDPDASHAYVSTPIGAVLTSGTATVTGGNERNPPDKFNLSHACPGTPQQQENAPAASIEADCQGVHVTLDNTGSDGSVDFEVTINGDTTTHSVPAGETDSVDGDLLEDGSWSADVRVGEETLASDEGQEECTTDTVAPAAEISASCDGVEVFLDNSDSDVTVNFEVTINGETTNHPVGAGETDTVTGDLGENGNWGASVKANGETLADDGGQITDCGPQNTEVTTGNVTFTDVSCDVSTPAVNLPDTEGVEYTVDGTVAPGQTVSVFAHAKQGYELAPGAQSEWVHTFKAAATDCETTPPATTPPTTPPATNPPVTTPPNTTEVLGTETEQPQPAPEPAPEPDPTTAAAAQEQLAATGAGSTDLLLLALLLAGLGAAALLSTDPNKA